MKQPLDAAIAQLSIALDTVVTNERLTRGFKKDEEQNKLRRASARSFRRAIKLLKGVQ
jgi:hypothetical protein